MPDPLRCDFCGKNPDWLYPCRQHDFGIPTGVPGVTHGSDTAWLACFRCHSLIGRTDRRELARVATDAAIAEHRRLSGERLLRPPVAKMVRYMHDQFWQAREGPARRLTAEDRERIKALPAQTFEPFEPDDDWTPPWEQDD